MNSKNFSEILDLIGDSGEKYVIIEEGRPSCVLMNMKEYKKMAGNSRNLAIEGMSKEELVEKINKDIALWRSSQSEKEEEMDDHFLSGEPEENNLEEETEYLYDVEKDF